MRVQQFSPQPRPPPKTLTVAWLNEFGSFRDPIRSAVESPLLSSQQHATSGDRIGSTTQSRILASASETATTATPAAPVTTAGCRESGQDGNAQLRNGSDSNSLHDAMESRSLLEICYEDRATEAKEVFLVKRANHLSSQMLGCEQHLLDREARFHHELREVAMRSACCTGSAGTASKTSEPSCNDGFYEVIFREVAVRSHPTTSSMIAKLLRKGDVLRGSLLPGLGKETWISLHVDTKEAMALEVDREYFAPVCSARVGLGDLLRRRRGAAGAAREDWRHWPQQDSGPDGGFAIPRPAPRTPSTSSDSGHPRSTAPVLDRWKRLISNKWNGTLRIPRCAVWHWDGDWRNFLLVEESFRPEEWRRLELDECCTDEQAASAVRALGALHERFSSNGLLEGAKWLPLLPFHEERSGFIQNNYRVAFRLVRGELKSLMSRTAFELCEKLCDGYALAVEPLSRPPLTLLHGDFRATSLWFSNSEFRPMAGANDWRLVCRGRGAYDFMTLLVSVGPTAVRREMELWLVHFYMISAGLCAQGSLQSTAARATFEADCRAALLAMLAHAIIFGAGMLQACSNFEESEAGKQISRIAAACDDWDAISLLGGSQLETAEQRHLRVSRHSLRTPEQTSKRYRNRLSRGALSWAERTQKRCRSCDRSELCGPEAASKKQVDLDETRRPEEASKRPALKKSSSSKTKVKTRVKVLKR